MFVVSFVCRQVQSLCRQDPPTRGVLQIVVCLSVIMKPRLGDLACSLFGNMGSNPSASMDVCLL